MQLSTKGRYAVMAMVDLAAREVAGRGSELSCLADIAHRQQLSLSYLEQLFGKLRRAGLVRSARGPGGGYCLALPPSKIAIGDIVVAVDERITTTRCEIGSGGCMLAEHVTAEAASGEKCQTHDLWAELGHQIGLFLQGITLADVVLGRVVGRAVGLPPLGTGPLASGQFGADRSKPARPPNHKSEHPRTAERVGAGRDPRRPGSR